MGPNGGVGVPLPECLPLQHPHVLDFIAELERLEFPPSFTLSRTKDDYHGRRVAVEFTLVVPDVERPDQTTEVVSSGGVFYVDLRHALESGRLDELAYDVARRAWRDAQDHEWAEWARRDGKYLCDPHGVRRP